MRSDPQPADGFLRLFDPDPDQAEAKYAELTERLTRFFEWRHCRCPDDLAQETLRRGLTRLSTGAEVRTEDPSRYFFGIAKFVLRETWKTREHDQLDPAGSDVNSTDDMRRVEGDVLLRECLEALTSDERALLWRYHSGDRAELRRDLGLSDSALRVRVHRLIQRVRETVHARRGMRKRTAG